MYSRQVPDYYKVLDVNKTATLKEIKYAYIKLAKKYHPDRNHNINEAEKIFKAIERAYSILSNPKERKKYDLFNFKTFKQDFKKNTRDFSVKKENYQKHNNTYNDYNDKEKSDSEELDGQNQEYELLYSRLLLNINDAILKRDWEKVEENLELASSFADLFKLNINWVESLKQKYQYYSEKIIYKDIFKIYRADYEIIENFKLPFIKTIEGHLIKLILTERFLKFLPHNIGDLINLQELFIINKNQLKIIPKSLANLINLRKLFLKVNKLIHLTPSIGNLTNLEWLYIEGNQLKTLPNSFGNMCSLKKLYFEGNRLNFIPESFGNLASLEWLYLEGKQLKKLPKKLCNLNKLRVLGLENTQIESLPDSFEKLNDLRILNLEGNNLIHFPKNIDKLKKLKILNLKRNKLSNISCSIGNLENLKILNLIDNPLFEIPESIGDLLNLEKIYIDSNNLSILPKSIKNLDNLEITCLRKEFSSKPIIPRYLKRNKNNIKINFLLEEKLSSRSINKEIIKSTFEKNVKDITKDIESENLFKFLEKQAYLELIKKEKFKQSLMNQASLYKTYRISKKMPYSYA